MKTTYIELAGNKYPLCFSLSAVEELCEEYGDLENMSAALTSAKVGEKLKAVSRVLEILMTAGRRYNETMGLELPPPLKGRPADLIDVTDGKAIEAIFAAIKADSKREVEGKAKNA